ncbi:signal peptide peptidase SppA [Phormidium sp. LEGE 05292]|uniref:signal peptide peptidase SppA n=1 Tax=[Phormidium] sp. LEGE 05292 TaxID=767427 RepID=UPI00187FC4B6|nr:signal peptide peptidase SppA [Phormidium sp. LEGE 05292]MBE9226817.1 signal peptide peptidase SppA [Phormidium sp. LEGE 05292]
MRDFFKYTFASFLGILIFFGLGTGGLIFLLISAAIKDTGPQVKDKSVLVFDLSTKITDTNPGSGTGEFLQKAVSGERDNALTLRTVLETINKAAADKRIVAIYLDGNGESDSGISGFATLKEVRRALENFKATGKKIIAYDLDWDEPNYYLGSVANTLIVNPMGAVEVNGLRSETMFLSGALEKYGIGVQILRVGKYKSAVEPFILKEFSSENRQQTQRLLNDIWGDFRATVGKSRQLTPQQIQAIADNKSLLIATEAQKSRLVDKVAYFDEVITDLKKLTGSDDEDEKTFRQISLNTYARVPANEVGQERTSKNKIAIVYAEGEIVSGQGTLRQVGGDRIASQLRQLRQNKDVKAVILRVNSPGGSASASEIIQREVKLTRQVKPVVVSMGNYAASGGYWISTYANRIFAETNTITGSIGVFGILPNLQKLANNNGVTWDVVKTGRFADSQTVARPKNPQELAIYQTSVNLIYYQFVGKVADSRKLPPTRVQEIAQGRVWSGLAAKQIGLVDEIGGINEAVKYAAKEAKLGDDWELKQFGRSGSLEERIFKNLFSYAPSISSEEQPVNTVMKFGPFAETYQYLKEELQVLSNLNDPLNIYARLPYNLRID